MLSEVQLLAFQFIFICFLGCANGHIAYECGSAATELRKISLNHVAECKIPHTEIKTEATQVQLLQLDNYQEIRVIQCKINIKRQIYHCGMHSHSSIVENGVAKFLQEMNHLSCAQLHLSRSYSYERKLTVSNLPVNATIKKPFIAAGTVDKEGHCSGEEYSDPFGSWKTVTVHAEVEISLYEQLARVDTAENKIHFSSGTACTLTYGSCIDSENGYSFWDPIPKDYCKFNHYSVLFEGRVQKTTDNSNGTIYPVVYTLSTPEYSFSLAITGQLDLCGHTVLRSEHPQLFTYETNGVTFASKRISITNIDLTAYVNSKFVYVEKILSVGMKQMYSDILRTQCELEKMILRNSIATASYAPDIFAYHLMQEPGYMAVLTSESAYITKCIAVDVEIVEHGDECYVELRVSHNNQTFFMTPITHILKTVGTKKVCNAIFPTEFEINKVWYSMLKELRPSVTAPQDLMPQTTATWLYRGPRYLATSGIYNTEDLKHYHESVMFMAEKQGLLNDVAKEVKTNTSPQSGGVLGNLLNDNAVEKWFSSFWSKLWIKFTTFGSFCSALISMMIFIQVIKFVIETVLNGIALHRIYGFSIHLLAAMWNSVTHFLVALYERAPRDNDIPQLAIQPRANNIPQPSAPAEEAVENENNVYITIEPEYNISFPSNSNEDTNTSKPVQQNNDICLKVRGNFDNYNNKRCEERYTLAPSRKKARLNVPAPEVHQVARDPEILFDYDNNCVICTYDLDRKHKKVSVFSDKTDKDHILNLFESKQVDEATIDRLKIGFNIAHQEISYHRLCYTSISNKKVPTEQSPQIPLRISQQKEAFEKLFKYIEQNSANLKFSLNELRKVLLPSKYDIRTIFKELEEKFKDEIRIEQRDGRQPIIFYKIERISDICCQWLMNDRISISDTHKKFFVEIAASMVSEDVKSAPLDCDSYPPSSKFLNDAKSCIPLLLDTFLINLFEINGEDPIENIGSKQFCGKLVKKTSIAHSIMCMIRPQFLSTLQLSIGIYIYRKSGSRLIIDMLSKLGACASYYKIRIYEALTIIHAPTLKFDGAFSQYVFDNTDHNVSTLDGKETFHCLGGITVYTPHHSIEYEGRIMKCKRMPSVFDLTQQNQIKEEPIGEISEFPLQNVEFVDVKKLLISKLDIFPKKYCAYILITALQIDNSPSWKGFFESITGDTSYEQSSIFCLPFINAPPSSLTTLNTAIHHAKQKSEDLNQKLCFITFDQPLYYKARGIVFQNPNFKNVKIRLRGFHLLMSYMGSIGHIMSGSGLQDLWCTIYAAESTKKMLTGHAYARALRAHILTFTAIGEIICGDFTYAPSTLTEIKRFYFSKEFQVGTINSNVKINRFRELFIERIETLEARGKTAKLWIQYFKMVTVMLQYIEAERLGDWALHLRSVKAMLPIFHAAGHFAYAKSAQIYLQDMAALEYEMKDCEDEFKKFTKEGYFTIRRSDKAWSEVWSDMVIEQTLNRFFGTDLRHGRGVTDGVVARYLFAMPAALDVMSCIEEYCQFESHLSEQHVDLSNSRIQRDRKDIEQLIFWLNNRKPFSENSSLISLSTGVIAVSSINCHLAFEVGERAMSKMVGKNVHDVSLSMADRK
ncbi:hypothetical protein TKK_0019392 [Trichogramma kaykai]